MNACSLVMIEWEDCAQPMAGWAYPASLDASKAMRCVSVGWMIHNGDDVKALSPNIGNFDEESDVQVSGTIRIPTRCITRIIPLVEPKAMGACDVAAFSQPPSPPESEQEQRTS